MTSGQLTYDLRRLRIHGLIHRISGTFRYQVTAASENHRNPVTVSYLSGGDPEDAAESIRPSG